MTIREKLIALLGGELPDDEQPVTGDPCLDEGHDLLEIRAATSQVPLARRCQRCLQWIDPKGNPVPRPQ